MQITGSDFGYGNDGMPISGTVHTVGIYDGFGNQIANLILGDAPLEDVMGDDQDDFWSVLLSGDDQIFTSHHDDTIFGYDGNDIIGGGHGDDHIEGGFGNDTIYGNDGDDFVDGGHGNDTLHFAPEAGHDTLEGGSGNDTAVYTGLDTGWPDYIYIEKAPAMMQVAAPLQTESVGSTTVWQQAFAGQAADVVVDEYRYAGDVLERPSDSYVARTRGDDRNPYQGPESIETYSGSADYGDVLMRVGSFTGTDDPEEPEWTQATIREIEQIELVGRAASDQLYVENLNDTHLEHGHVFFDGGAGDDNLHASATTTDITYLWHWIEGDPGDGDVSFGFGSKDAFHFLDDTDDVHVLTLDAGNDHVDLWEGPTGFGFSPDIQIWNAEFLDFDFGGGDSSFVVRSDLSSVYGGVLDVEFGGGASLLDVYGHTGRIEAVGGDDHNAFFSGEGDDLLVGGASHDDIFGRAGEDEIIGGGGDDDIGGGEGDDMIEGGKGFDRFFFEENSGTDTVVDFEIDVDLLDNTSYAGTIGQDDLAVAQFGADTHITAPDGSTVILAGIQSKELDSSEFLF